MELPTLCKDSTDATPRLIHTQVLIPVKWLRSADSLCIRRWPDIAQPKVFRRYTKETRRADCARPPPEWRSFSIRSHRGEGARLQMQRFFRPCGVPFASLDVLLLTGDIVPQPGRRRSTGIGGVFLSAPTVCLPSVDERRPHPCKSREQPTLKNNWWLSSGSLAAYLVSQKTFSRRKSGGRRHILFPQLHFSPAPSRFTGRDLIFRIAAIEDEGGSAHLSLSSLLSFSLRARQVTFFSAVFSVFCLPPPDTFRRRENYDNEGPAFAGRALVFSELGEGSWSGACSTVEIAHPRAL